LAADIVRHMVDAADAGAAVVDDIGHRGGVESAGREHVGRGVDDALLCRIGLRPSVRRVSGSFSHAAPSTESSEGAAVVMRRS
jgi:hypothetical protein